MLLRPEPATLAIADISGYTGYLAEVELDHAQDILGDLVATVIGALKVELRKNVECDMASLGPALEVDAAARAAGLFDEPSVSASAGRYLREPQARPIEPGPPGARFGRAVDPTRSQSSIE